MSAALALVLSYLAGSLPFAIWTGKALHGVDVRRHGSGNAGATNVFRVLGWKTGLLVFLLDAAKGWLAAGPLAGLAVTAAGGPLGATAGDVQTWHLVCGLVAILGHLFPVFAGFKGGKGVATSAGALLAVTPLALGLAVVAFAVGFGLTRYVAIGSLAAAVVYPATLVVQRFGLGQDVPPAVLALGTALGALLFVTHRTNLARLRAGTESKIAFRRSAAPPPPSAPEASPDPLPR